MLPSIHTIKIIWIAVTLIGILHVLPTIATAQFAGGSGTEEDPYQIETIEQLQAIADSANLDKHYIQIADIDASETAGWNEGKGLEPLGWWEDNDNNEPFTGSYDGNGYTITELHINRPDEGAVGLFGYAENADFNNVAFLNIAVTGGGAAGGLVGRSNYCEINGSFATGIVSGERYVGGLAGSNGGHTGKINDSHAIVNVSGDHDVGGLAGFSSGEIINSYSTGDVTGREAVGGLIGNTNECIINGSYATGNVSGNIQVGGLVGKIWNSDVIDSYATGNVTGSERVGGLIGWQLVEGGKISGSYASGNVSGSNGVGGLVGHYSDGIMIIDSYASGNVRGENFIGGLVGINSAPITNSYSIGEVLGDSIVGGLVGSNDGSIQSSYWDIETSGHSEGIGSGEEEGVLGLTTDQMTGSNAGEHMSELDFEEIWQLTDGYPLLAWQNPEDVLALLTVDPMEHDFGDVDPDSASSHEFTIRNMGNDFLSGEAALSGTSNAAFEIIRGEGAWSLKPYRSMIVEVEFHPSSEGNYQAVLEISHDAQNEENPLEVALSGTGKTPLSANPDEPLPQRFELLQNYPNPFNPVTIIPFELPESSEVRLEIYDLLGRQVALLTDQTYEAGRHEVSWNPAAAASGVYIVRMTVLNSQGQHRLFNNQVTLIK